MPDLISVVVPVYNAAQYLRKCVDSILGQSYYNLELILVDDGSEDESLKICNQYQMKDSRVQVIHQCNAGQAAARQTGINRAVGDYITFVDADDYIESGAFEQIVLLLDPCKPDIVAYGMTEVYSDRIIEKRNNFEEGVYFNDKLNYIYEKMLSYGSFFEFGILPNIFCKMVKSTFMRQAHVCVSKDVKFGEDADVVFQLVVQAESIQIIDNVAYQYCKRNDSMTWKNMDLMTITHLEADLSNAFKRAGIEKVMEEQLIDYITFITLLKQPSTILNTFYPFSDLTIKIGLYGAGGMGQAIRNQMDANIVMWVDRDYEKYREQGFKVESLDTMIKRQDEYDVIFIAISNEELCEKIKKDLENKGIGKKIYYYFRKRYNEDCLNQGDVYEKLSRK